MTDLVRWQAAQAELVLPTGLPDGLLYAWRAGQERPESYLVEIATYPELRTSEQALRGMLLVYLDRGEIPNVLVVVLQPRGKLRVPNHATRSSNDGVAKIDARWRVVELWTLPAEPVLASANPGIIPWVPLMRSAEPPESVLRQCREVIDRHAPIEEHDNLIAVTQVFARLRYKDPNLLTILGGRTAMIESPLLQEIVAERMHKDILKILAIRLGPLPAGLPAELGRILDESVLDAIVDLAASCSDIGRFETAMRAIPIPPSIFDMDEYDDADDEPVGKEPVL